MSLRHFNKDQNAFVLECLAQDMKSSEILPLFRDMFPEFGEGVLIKRERLDYLLTERFRRMSREKSDTVDDLKDDSVDSLAHIPIANALYRLKCLQQLWRETPAKSLTKRCEDPNGDLYEVYKVNTADRIRILEQARLEERELQNLADSLDKSVSEVVPVKGGFGDVSTSHSILGTGLEEELANENESGYPSENDGRE